MGNYLERKKNWIFSQITKKKKKKSTPQINNNKFINVIQIDTTDI